MKQCALCPQEALPRCELCLAHLAAHLKPVTTRMRLERLKQYVDEGTISDWNGGVRHTHMMRSGQDTTADGEAYYE